MKTEKRYTKLTHEAALKLLQENSWRVDHCVFDDFDDGPAMAVHGPNLGLAGMHEGRFVATSGSEWKHCWKVDEVQFFEVGDRVRVKDAHRHGSNYVGAIAEITARYDNGAHLLGFGDFGRVFFPGELELAPDPDPFDKWLVEYSWEHSVPYFKVKSLKKAFNAGRDYERGQK